MTPFDFTVLAIVGFSFLLGILRGVVSEILGLIAWVTAFFAARLWALQAGNLLLNESGDALWRQLLGFVTVFVAVLLLFALLRLLMTMLLKAAGLRPFDRMLGAAFGVARGLMMVLVLVLAAGLTPLPRETWWQQSLLAAPLETAVLMASPWLPSELSQRIHYR